MQQNADQYATKRKAKCNKMQDEMQQNAQGFGV